MTVTSIRKSKHGTPVVRQTNTQLGIMYRPAAYSEASSYIKVVVLLVDVVKQSTSGPAHILIL